MKIIMKNTKLQHRIFFYFSALLILSTALFGAYAYRANVNSSEDNFTKLISGNLTQSANNVRTLLYGTERQIALFSYSYTVQNVLSKRNPSIVEQYDDYKMLDSLISSFEKNNDALSIKLYADTSNRFLDDGVRYFSAPQRIKDGQGELLMQRNNQLAWKIKRSGKGAGKRVDFICVAKIINIGDIGRQIATVTFGLDGSQFNHALSNMDMPSVRSAYLLDSDGNVLSSSNGESIGTRIYAPPFFKKIASQPFGSQVAKLNGNRNLVVYQSLPGTPFMLTADVPLQAISNRSMAILRNFIWISLSILILSFMIAYVISTNLTRRIKLLVNAMGTLEKNEFHSYVPLDYNDEIGILSRKFNWMVERIRILIRDVYQTNLEKKAAELNLLQAQINPHFLYNTLDSINWLAIKHQEDEISYMIRNLSSFLRYSLNSEGSTTIGTEIRHLQAYFNIQKFRFEDRIRLDLEVPEELMKYETQSLILQPLVENAILHGILAEGEQTGTVTIRGSLQDGQILLEVSDNGRGMPEGRLKQVQEKMRSASPEDRDGMGRGLRNVHQRIRIRYGDEYGVNLVSMPGRGTQIFLIFPAIF